MFRSAVRAARPAVLAARSNLKSSGPSTVRAFHNSLRVSEAHGPAPPQLYGPGGKAGEVPSNIEQATGLERLQLLGELEGIKVFDDAPLDTSRIGTKADPILVPSYVRFVPFVVFIVLNSSYLRMLSVLSDALVHPPTPMTYGGSS